MRFLLHLVLIKLVSTIVKAESFVVDLGFSFFPHGKVTVSHYFRNCFFKKHNSSQALRKSFYFITEACCALLYLISCDVFSFMVPGSQTLLHNTQKKRLPDREADVSDAKPGPVIHIMESQLISDSGVSCGLGFMVSTCVHTAPQSFLNLHLPIFLWGAIQQIQFCSFFPTSTVINHRVKVWCYGNISSLHCKENSEPSA